MPFNPCSHACEYFMLYGKRDFADVIITMDPKIGRLSWITRWAQSNHLSPQKAEKFLQLGSKRCYRRTERESKHEKGIWLAWKMEGAE